MKTNKEIAEKIASEIHFISMSYYNTGVVIRKTKETIIQALDSKDAEGKGKIDEMIKKFERPYPIDPTIIKVLQELKKELYGE